MKLICVKCGIIASKINGSMRYPVCDKCFEKYFKKDNSVLFKCITEIGK